MGETASTRVGPVVPEQTGSSWGSKKEGTENQCWGQVESPWVWARVLLFAIGAKGSHKNARSKGRWGQNTIWGHDWHQDEKDIREEKLVSGRWKAMKGVL